MAMGDRMRIYADLMDRVIFPPRGPLGTNTNRTATAVAVAHKAKVLAAGHCWIKKQGRDCWMCSFRLRLRRKRATNG